MSQTIDQQFVEFIVKTIVTNPDDVSVERTIDEKGVLLELTVAPDDLGRVIGRRGMTAQSIRTLLRALGVKNDARYNLKIVDVNGGDRPERPATPVVDTSNMITDDHKDISRDDVAPSTKTEEVEQSEEEAMVEQKRKEVEELAELDI